MYLLYFLFFVLFGSYFSFIKVEGLRGEEIIGGIEGNLSDSKAIAVIMYNPQVRNMSDQHPCTAAIISDLHVATLAQCFYDETGQLLNKQFYVGVSILELSNTEGAMYINIFYIVIPHLYDPTSPNTYAKSGNIAIARLSNPLKLIQGHRTLKRLRFARELFMREDQVITVSGFGWNRIFYRTTTKDGQLQEVLVGSSDTKLRVAKAELVGREICQNRVFQQRIGTGNICAKIIQETDERKGICEGDAGAPLVRGDSLVGLAIQASPKCNENEMPGMYISIPFYYNFIKDVTNRKPKSTMRIYRMKQTTLLDFEFSETDELL